MNHQVIDERTFSPRERAEYWLSNWALDAC